MTDSHVGTIYILRGRRGTILTLMSQEGTLQILILTGGKGILTFRGQEGTIQMQRRCLPVAALSS